MSMLLLPWAETAPDSSSLRTSDGVGRALLQAGMRVEPPEAGTQPLREAKEEVGVAPDHVHRGDASALEHCQTLLSREGWYQPG